MPAKGPVSMAWQTIFCFIPAMDIVASYRVKRLRKYLLVMLGIGLGFGIIDLLVAPGEIFAGPDPRFYSGDSLDWDYILLGGDTEHALALFIANLAVAYVAAVYLIRRWSRMWNEQLIT